MGSIFISLLNFAFRPTSKAVWACASIFDFFLRYEDNRYFSVSWRRSLIVQIRKKPFQSPEAILKQGMLAKSMVKNQHFQRKPPNFVKSNADSLSKSAESWFSKWIFCVKNHPTLSYLFLNDNLFLIFITICDYNCIHKKEWWPMSMLIFGHKTISLGPIKKEIL